MTLSQATATQGTQITVSPTGTAALPVNNSYVNVTTIPSTSVTYSNSAWKFTMPANNTTVSGVFKADPQLTFSKASATAYMTASMEWDYHELPTLSYVSGFTGGVNYAATGSSSYVNDIVFVGDKPTVSSDSSAYAYIWGDNGSIEVTAVAYSYTTDDYYSNSAEYTLTITKE